MVCCCFSAGKNLKKVAQIVKKKKVKPNIVELIGRVVIESSGYFKLIKDKELFRTIFNRCKLLQKADGYSYYKQDYDFIRLHNNSLVTICNL